MSHFDVTESLFYYRR